MVGFNYIRTPASQFARQIVASGEIGEITYFRGEHTEDFLADPATPANWRTRDRANGQSRRPGSASSQRRDGADGAHRRADRRGRDGAQDAARTRTVRRRSPTTITRRSSAASRAACSARFLRAASRPAGRWDTPTRSSVRKAAIRFDQEDQNAFGSTRPRAIAARRGFTKILTGPTIPDYRAFCLGPGHGTGYQDQIIIEARDFLEAIATGKAQSGRPFATAARQSRRSRPPGPRAPSGAG